MTYDLEKIEEVCSKASTIEIPLNKGFSAIIDAEDYEKISQYKWRAVKFSKGKTFYAVTSVHFWLGVNKYNEKHVFMHRFLINVPDGMSLDHKNRNGLDNRKCNLRICTPSQNEINKPPMSGRSSIYKGVYWHITREKWVSTIQKEGSRLYLGYFNNEEDAARAYDKAASELFGEFAYLNFSKNIERGVR